MKTYVVCLSYTEFVQYLRRVPNISVEENAYKNYPYVYANKEDKITERHNFQVVLWGKYWKSDMYKSEFYDKVLRNKAVAVADSGGSAKGSIQARKSGIEYYNKKKRREMGLDN
jgi:hypothetical protein